MVCRRTPGLPKKWASSLGCNARIRRGRVRIVSETGPRAPGREDRSRAPACQVKETEGQGQADVKAGKVMTGEHLCVQVSLLRLRCAHRVDL